MLGARPDNDADVLRLYEGPGAPTSEDLLALLERENLMTFIGPGRSGAGRKMADDAGSEIWSISIGVESEGQASVRDNTELAPHHRKGR